MRNSSEKNAGLLWMTENTVISSNPNNRLKIKVIKPMHPTTYTLEAQGSTSWANGNCHLKCFKRFERHLLIQWLRSSLAAFVERSYTLSHCQHSSKGIGASSLWPKLCMPCFTCTTPASCVMISLPSIYLEEEALSFQKHTASSQNRCHLRLPADDVMRQVNCEVTGWLPPLLVAARHPKAELCTHMGCFLWKFPFILRTYSEEGDI